MNDQSRRKVSAAKSAVVAGWLEVRDRDEGAAREGHEPGPPSPPGDETGGTGDEESALDRYMPTPQIAAVAVMALLAAGVILGAVTDQFAQSAGAPVVLLGSPASAPEEAVEPEAVEEEVVYEEGPESAPAAEAPPEEQPEFEEPLGEPEAEPEVPFELPPEAVLPPVTHLFLIVLGDQGFETTFGKRSTSPYLSSTLAAKGEVLNNYYGVAQGDLANEIGLLSGQGPTAQTAANCPEYTDVTPGAVDPATVGTTEQVEGTGCVYPASTLTLPGQLTAAGKTWKAYVEAPGGLGPEQETACEPGSNPLAYFHSLLDSGECAAAAVGLDQLVIDLKSPGEMPTFSYIAPNACHDGSELPCAPGRPAGMAGAESFLETVVPEIESSPAYTVGGMIAITFAQAPQTGDAADQRSCCVTPQYPNLNTDSSASPAPAAGGPVKPTGGGGRVGMLLLSPYVLPGSVNKSGYFNHFVLLRSIEELFGLPPLGYAADPAVVPFDETVYNNLES